MSLAVHPAPVVLGFKPLKVGKEQNARVADKDIGDKVAPLHIVAEQVKPKSCQDKVKEGIGEPDKKKRKKAFNRMEDAQLTRKIPDEITVGPARMQVAGFRNIRKIVVTINEKIGCTKEQPRLPPEKGY